MNQQGGQAFMTQQAPPAYGYGAPPMGYPMGGYMPVYAPMPPQPIRYVPVPQPMYADYGYASCGNGYDNMYDMGYGPMTTSRGMDMGLRPRNSSQGARGQFNGYDDEEDFEYPSQRVKVKAADKEPAIYEMPDLNKLKPKKKKSYDRGIPGYEDLDRPEGYIPRNRRGIDGPEYKVTSTGTPLPISKEDLLPPTSIDEWEQRREEDRKDRNVDVTLVPQMRRKARQVATQINKYHPNYHEPRHFGDRHVPKLVLKHPDMNEEEILEEYVGRLQMELNEIGQKYDPCNDAPEIVFKEREKPPKVAHKSERLAITYPEDEYLNNMDNLSIRCLSHYKGTRNAAKTEVMNPRQFIRDTKQVLPETFASKYESSIPDMAEPANEDGNSSDKKPFIPFYYGLTNRRIDTDEEKALAINYTYEDKRNKALDIYDYEKKALTYEVAEKPLDAVGSTASKYTEPAARKSRKTSKKQEEPAPLDEPVPMKPTKMPEEPVIEEPVPMKPSMPEAEPSMLDEPVSQKSAFVTELKSKLAKVSPAKESDPPVTSPKSVSISEAADDVSSPALSFSEDPDKEKKRLEKKKRKAEREAAAKAAMEAELSALAAAEAELQRLEQEEARLKST